MSQSSKILMEQLSPEQQQSLTKILSIQDFYKLTDHKKLIKIILDRKQCEKFFASEKMMISNMFDTANKQMTQRQKMKIFAQKYSYQKLVDKFPRPKAGTNDVFLTILKYKMKNQVISSHHTRKNIWLLASGAKFAMRVNKGLYENLVRYPDYPEYFERQIGLDLNRTVSKAKQTCKQQIESLKNVLTAFSRKNPYVGYCQGLNFVAYFILMMQFSEEESFWLLCQIVQTIIPMDYYTNMIGVVCDQQIFIEVLRVVKPRITEKFKQVQLNASVLSIEWFVCLFASSLPLYLVKILWDRLFVQGTAAFIKAGVIIMSHFQDQILATTQFHQIIFILEKGTKSLTIAQQDFNSRFEKIYINTKGLKLARELYRQYHIMQKLADKNVTRKRKQDKIECKHSWPICLRNLQQHKRQKRQFEVWIFRQQGGQKLIHDYLQNIQKKKNNYRSTVTNGSLIKQVGLIKQVKISESKQINEYVIGRIHHICNDQLPGFTKKNNSNKVSPLKTILQVSEFENQSQLVLEQQIRQQELDFTRKFKRFSLYDSQNNNQVMRSQTVEFFTNFVHNNKQLAGIIAAEQQDKVQSNV